MKERINRLAMGIVDAARPQMVWTPDAIEETIRTNTVVKRELFIGTEGGGSVKGLAYSTSDRVRIPADCNSFGGVRNHIIYEVDTSFMQAGDEIDGMFNLVTSCGEVEIPYVFYVDLAASGSVLSGLKTAEDFAEIARKDGDTALRLLEYPDFLDAPFMQEPHVRAVYEGLKGHGERQSFMEEFLTGLKVKEPFRIFIDGDRKRYENPSGHVQDSVVIRGEGWGYVSLEAEADGDFIHLLKRSATQEDFKDGACELPFLILSENLHGGKNYGAVFVTAAGERHRIDIEAEAGGGRKPNLPSFGEDLKNYMELRLQYEGAAVELSEEPSKEPTAEESGRQGDGGRRQREETLPGRKGGRKKADEGDKRAPGRRRLAAAMGRLLDQMKISYEDVFIRLLEAEYLLATGKRERAASLIDAVREQVLAERETQVMNYCLFQYVQVSLSGDEAQREAFLRLLRRYFAGEQGNFYLYMMILRLDPELSGDPAAVYADLRRQFREGCASPFLYLEACRILAEEPGFFRGIEPFESHALYFGAKRGLISEETALAAARAMDGGKEFWPFGLKLLTALYGLYQEERILSAVCAMLIRGDCRGSRYFPWYERGVEAGLTLTRLYEYYLYSMPEDYHKPLPREMLLYFSYGNELDAEGKGRLYRNVLEHCGRDDTVFRLYERSIEKFALSQLFEGKINQDLAVIYSRMIYRDVIDRQLAKVLPSVLKANRVTVKDSSIRCVVVRHEELTAEDAYPVRDGAAYVPLFSERDILLFQDGAGNRFVSTPYEKAPAMDGEELAARCFEVYPEHPILLLNACQKAMEREMPEAPEGAGKGGAQEEDGNGGRAWEGRGNVLQNGGGREGNPQKGLDGGEARVLLRALSEPSLHPIYRKKIISALTRYYTALAEPGSAGAAGSREQAVSFLLSVEKDAMSPAERAQIMKALISQGYYAEAYDMLCRYGSEELGIAELRELVVKMLLDTLLQRDERLLNLSFQVFAEGKAESTILGYLCEHFNGTVDQMFRILLAGIHGQVDTADLEERLLCQMLFTGCTEKMDRVFDFYASRKKTKEMIVKAYFTVKCIEYFMEGKPAQDKVFAYLEGAVHGSSDRERIPDIYLLALTKYYSGLSSLTEEQRELCQSITAVLLEAGMEFAYFKELSRFAPVPQRLLDKEIIEFHGEKDSEPLLKVRILPEEQEFTCEELKEVYKGIFIREKVVFEGEVLEYQIYRDRGDSEPAAAGSLERREPPVRTKGSRFALLNEMSLSYEVKNENTLRKQMESYQIRDAVTAELFGVI